jgi:cytochrome c biogenesis protein CcmG/thiol:disulfide interchange protein DsbE
MSRWVIVFLVLMVCRASGAEVGDPIPEFTLRTFDGTTVSRATLAGQPLLLIFWNTWCPNCMRELPEINRLAGKFGPGGLKVLAVNSAINDSEKKARAYWENQGYIFPTGFDHYFEIGQAFGLRGVPTVFLVDSKGIVRFKQARVPDDTVVENETN